MTLKELVKVMVGYTTVHVHDKEGRFACRGNPHQFTMGLYKSHGDDKVCLVSAISPYNIEVIVEEENK